MSERTHAVILISHQDMEFELIEERGYPFLYFNRRITLDDALRATIPVEMNLNDEEQAVAQAVKLARSFTILGVYCLNEYRIPLACRIARALGIPHALSYEAAINCRNKKRTKELLVSHGINTARFKLIHTIEEAKAATAEIPLPVIVKPSNESGSSFVRRCATLTEIRHAMELIQHQNCNWVGQVMDHEVLVEEYLDGPEFSVEACTIRGKTTILAITHKQITPWPLTVEVSHCVPASLSDRDTHAIHHAVTQALAALDIDNSVTHTELKLTATGPRIIEVNARRGGDKISTLVRGVTGYDLTELSLHIALGGTLTDAPRHEIKAASAVSQFFIAERGGVVDFNDPVPLGTLPGVYSLDIAVEQGERVEPTTSNFNRLGQFIIYGTPERHATDIAAEVFERLAIRVS